MCNITFGINLLTKKFLFSCHTLTHGIDLRRSPLRGLEGDQVLDLWLLLLPGVDGGGHALGLNVLLWHLGIPLLLRGLEGDQTHCPMLLLLPCVGDGDHAFCLGVLLQHLGILLLGGPQGDQVLDLLLPRCS